MKSKTVLNCLVAVLVFAAGSVPGWAQQAGFQIGVPQAQFGFPPTQAPAIAVRGTFTAVPTPFVPTIQPITPISLVPNFPTVIVPNQIVVVGQTVLPGVIAGPVVNPSPVSVRPNPVQPGLPFAPSVGPAGPAVGMPRADVVRQFGQPSVTVITSGGETLYFTGGVTVIIQNGQVIGPR